MVYNQDHDAVKRSLRFVVDLVCGGSDSYDWMLLNKVKDEKEKKIIEKEEKIVEKEEFLKSKSN